jgi:hypothetical protein
MQKTIKVGGDIDAWCTKCKMVLGHTVLAMVGTKAKRVRCNTCQGEHNYRGTSEPVKRASSAARDKPVVTSWEALIAKKDVSRARKYSTKERFGQDEVLNHPVFGIGLVQEVRGDKIQVAFKADVKTLVHGK